MHRYGMVVALTSVCMAGVCMAGMALAAPIDGKTAKKSLFAPVKAEVEILAAAAMPIAWWRR